MKMQPISHFGNAEAISPYVTNNLFFADVHNLHKYYETVPIRLSQTPTRYSGVVPIT